MYRDILVPIVFDAEADSTAATTRHALDAAKALAAPGARVTLLHVMADAPAYAIDYMPEGWDGHVQRAIEADLRALAVTIPDAGVVVLHGSPGPAILDWVAANGIDLVIMASHRPGMRDYLIGGTAARVVRHAPCTVLVLR